MSVNNYPLVPLLVVPLRLPVPHVIVNPVRKPWESAPVPAYMPAEPVITYASDEDEKRHTTAQAMTPPAFPVHRAGSAKFHLSTDDQRTLCGLEGPLTRAGANATCKNCNAIAAKGGR